MKTIYRNNSILKLLFRDFSLFFVKLKRQVYLYRLKKKDVLEWTKEIWRYRGLRFGKNCMIFPNADILSEPFLVEIGNNVIITGGVKLLTHDGSIMIFRDEIGERETYGKIKVGNNVFVGMNSIILPNVTIGNNVIIGAGAVVHRNIPSNSVVSGNPAKVITKASIIKRFVMSNKNLLVRTSTLERGEAVKMLFKHFELNIDKFPKNFRHFDIIKKG